MLKSLKNQTAIQWQEVHVWTGERVQQVKVLSSQLDDPDVIAGTRTVEGEK